MAKSPSTGTGNCDNHDFVYNDVTEYPYGLI